MELTSRCASAPVLEVEAPQTAAFPVAFCPCPMSEFQVPENYGPSHAGGLHMLETAKTSGCPGVLFLSYHMASDLDGKITAMARALGTALPQRGQMYEELHAAFRKVRASHPKQRRYYLAYCLAITIALPVLSAWWLVKPRLVLGIVVATVFELYFLNIFHTRHHRSGQLYENELLAKLTTPLYDFIEATWGYCPKAWRMNHNVKHHVHTNDDDFDTDVPAMYPYVRSCYDSERRWFHEYQTFYWPVLVLGAAVQFPVNNIMVHNGRTFHFLSWLTFMFALPTYLHGWHGLSQSVFLQAWAGASVAYKFAVSHTHVALTSTASSNDAHENIDQWCQSQIAQSVSWGGYFSAFVFGGINMQVEHHLCPALDPPLYAFVAPEVARICDKYGIAYTAEPTLCHAVLQFHKRLWLLGSSSEPLLG